MSGIVWYQDIDGPLNVARHRMGPKYWGDVERFDVWANDRSWPIRRSLLLAQRIAGLIDRFDIEFVWATTWVDDIEAIDTVLGFPQGQRCLSSETFVSSIVRCGKSTAVEADAGDRAVIWIDDELRAPDHAWAKERDAPTLLVNPGPIWGLLPRHLEEIETWLAAL